MQPGGDVKAVFDRLARGIAAVGDSVKKEFGKEFMLDKKYGYIHSCPTNLGTGMRASVHVDLPGFTKEGLPALKKRCEELKVQPRGTRGESGGQTGSEKTKKIKRLNKSSTFQVSLMTFLTSIALVILRLNWSNA